MKTFFFYTVIIMLAISCMRFMAGYDITYNLSLSRFLALLSNLDIDFEHTIESIVDLRETLVMPNLPNVSNFLDVFSWIAGFFRYCLNLSVNVIGSIVGIIRDILDFLYSIVVFFFELVYPTRAVA